MKTIAKILSLSLPIAFAVVPVMASSSDAGVIANQLHQATLNVESGKASDAMLNIQNAKQYLIIHESKFPAHFERVDAKELARREHVSQIVEAMKTAVTELKAGRSSSATIALEKTDKLLMEYI